MNAVRDKAFASPSGLPDALLVVYTEQVLCEQAAREVSWNRVRKNGN